MKLEKCALCGGSQGLHVEGIDCPIPWIEDTLQWNRLQRAIRKAKRGGKVLFRGWIGKDTHKMVREFLSNPTNRCGSAVGVYVAPTKNNGWNRRVEVREAVR